MQILMPHFDYKLSAKCFDDKTLSQHRIDIWHTLEILLCNRSGILNGRQYLCPRYNVDRDPVVELWRHYEYQLIEYGKQICLEYLRRGNADRYGNRLDHIELSRSLFGREYPIWWGNLELYNTLLGKENNA